MIDGDITIVNDNDDIHAVAVREKAILMSQGTAAFIASMEREGSDSGSGGTVVEVATTEELRQFKR